MNQIAGIILANIGLLIASSAFGQTAKVSFQHFDLEIEPLELWNQIQLLDSTFSDHAEVNIELGSTLEGSMIKITGSQLTELSVEMRYETSITIMNEGPHCDLIHWKHYNSDWTSLIRLRTNTFKAKSYTKQEWEKFPNVTVKEIVEAVEAECSGWGELAKSIQSPTTYPSAVAVSRYFLRITGLDQSGKNTTHTVALNLPMGC